MAILSSAKTGPRLKVKSEKILIITKSFLKYFIDLLIVCRLGLSIKIPNHYL